MSIKITIRPYTVADKEDLFKIFRLNTPEYFDPKEEKEFAEYIEHRSDTYLVIEHHELIVGGVGYEFRDSDRSGRINWIFIHPQYSGLGLGRQAVEHCLKILRANPAVEVLIVRTSQWAYQFFEKCGYKLMDTTKDYWAPGLDLYLMEQAIDTNAPANA